MVKLENVKLAAITVSYNSESITLDRLVANTLIGGKPFELGTKV